MFEREEDRRQHVRRKREVVYQIRRVSVVRELAYREAHRQSQLREIGAYAFFETGLVEMTIPKCVHTMGNGAF